MLKNKDLLKRACSLLENYNNWIGDNYNDTVDLLDDMGTFIKDLLSSECSNKTQTYYQPVAYLDDGTNIEYGDIPEGLFSFQAFASREECEAWLKNNDYDPGDYAIIEHHENDIEGVTIIDEDGDIVEINEEG